MIPASEPPAPLTVSPTARLVSATTWTAAYDYYHDRYHAYYAAGLRQALLDYECGLNTRSLHRLPRLLRAARRVRSSYRLAGVMSRGLGGAIDRAAAAVAGRRSPPFGPYHPLVGQYVFEFASGKTVRLAIDAQDSSDIASPTLLDKCDVYAKTNFQPSAGYLPSVVPVCNGNPLVLPHPAVLRDLRGRPPEFDLCFVVRVWGGRKDEDGIEHNLRLLEAVNQVPGKKRLLAYLVAGDLSKQEKRLRRAGIPTTRSPLPLRQLWELSASARLNVIRLGMHNCIPWRYIDMLAMGAVVAFDQSPQTLWPTPLVLGEHFFQLGAATTADNPLASSADYNTIPASLAELLADDARMRQVRAAAADYYDLHACPAGVGRDLIGHVIRAGGGT